MNDDIQKDCMDSKANIHKYGKVELLEYNGMEIKCGIA